MRLSYSCYLSIVISALLRAGAFPHERRDVGFAPGNVGAGDGSFRLQNATTTTTDDDRNDEAFTDITGDYVFRCYNQDRLPEIVLETCQPNFFYLLHHWPDSPISFYKKSRVAPEPCGIELLPLQSGDILRTTNRQITTISHRILDACSQYRKGGYFKPTSRREGNVGWSVSVAGVFMEPFLLDDGGNATVGVGVGVEGIVPAVPAAAAVVVASSSSSGLQLEDGTVGSTQTS